MKGDRYLSLEAVAGIILAPGSMKGNRKLGNATTIVGLYKNGIQCCLDFNLIILK